MNDQLCTHEESESTMKQKIAELTSKVTQQIHISNAAILDRKMFCQQYKEIKVILSISIPVSYLEHSKCL